MKHRFVTAPEHIAACDLSPATVAALGVVLLAEHAGHQKRVMACLIALLSKATARTNRSATNAEARRAVHAVRQAGLFLPGRLACLEESVAVVLMLAASRPPGDVVPWGGGGPRTTARMGRDQPRRARRRTTLNPALHHAAHRPTEPQEMITMIDSPTLWITGETCGLGPLRRDLAELYWQWENELRVMVGQRPADPRIARPAR